MKKLIIAFFLVLGISQSQAQRTLKPGVRAGVNFSKLTNYDTDFLTGFYVGAQLGIQFNKLYTLQPELTYSRQGGNRTFDFRNLINPSDPDLVLYNQEKKQTLDYLCLSAISKFQFGNSFHVLVGPSLDFKVNDNFQESYSFRDPIGFDLALVAGVGFSLPNGLSFEARFKQGMVDVFGNNYNENVDQNNNGNFDEVVLNQSFQLGVAYTFDLKK